MPSSDSLQSCLKKHDTLKLNCRDSTIAGETRLIAIAVHGWLKSVSSHVKIGTEYRQEITFMRFNNWFSDWIVFKPKLNPFHQEQRMKNIRVYIGGFVDTGASGVEGRVAAPGGTGQA